MYAPRFLIVNGRAYLMAAELKAGQLIDLKGPYSIVGDTGIPPAVLAEEVKALLERALNEAPTLTMADLPSSIQEEIQAQLTEVSAPESDAEAPAETGQ